MLVKKLLFIFIIFRLLFVGDLLFAQDKDWQKISIGGVVTDDNQNLANATVTLLKGGVKVKRLATSETGLFIFNLQPSTDYILLISKEGYTTKKIFISTNGIPKEMDISWNSGITIDIFKTIRDLDVSILDNPVGKIYYYEEKKSFDYDKEYTKSIQSAIGVLENLLEDRKIAIRKEELALVEEQKRLDAEMKKKEEESLKIEIENAKILKQQNEDAKRIEKLKRDSLAKVEFVKKNMAQKQKFIQETKAKKGIEERNKEIADSLRLVKLAKKKIEEENATIFALELNDKKRKENEEKTRQDSVKNAILNETIRKRNEESVKDLYKKGNENAVSIIAEERKTKETIFPIENADSLVKINVKQSIQDSASEDIAKAKFNSKLTNEEKEELLLEIQKKYPQGITIEEETYPSFKITKIISNQKGFISEHKMIEFRYGKFFKKNGLDITEAVFRMETKGYEKYLKDTE